MPAYGQVPVKAPEGRPESAASAEPLSGRINSMPGPLTGFRVLELARILAGPWAGQILADLGADVVKVERKGTGDDTRAWGPPFLKDQSGAETREAGYYLCVNRGKRSITIELDKPEGQRVVRALAARSDIVLENFKVGTLKRFGLGYEDLKALNPGLIYCSITGFGQTGPRRDAPAYDFMIQAMCGLMSVTGEPDEKPGGGPEKVGVPIVDIMSGMYAAIAVLAALARRNETGRGRLVSVRRHAAVLVRVRVGDVADLLDARGPGALLGQARPPVGQRGRGDEDEQGGPHGAADVMCAAPAREQPSTAG